jgi:hypothetical protein
MQHHDVVGGERHHGGLGERRGLGDDLPEVRGPRPGLVDQHFPFQGPQVQPAQQLEHLPAHLLVPPVHDEHVARPV